MIKLLNLDCMDYLRTCSDNQFDLVIADPPYGMLGSKFVSKSKHFNNGKVSTLDGNGINAITLGNRPTEEYFNEIFRVSKHQIVFGMQYFVNYLKPTQCVIIWDKLTGDNKFSDFEIAWTSFETATRFIKKDNKYHGVPRIHPTQKPIYLYSWILQNYAKPDFKILDTHLGSANSAIAAHYFGCEFVGLEIDKLHYKNGICNYKKNTKQTALFF